MRVPPITIFAILLGGSAAAQLTERESVNSNGTQGNSYSYSPAVSSDGRFVAFFSLASNLVTPDSNSSWDVFVRDRQLGATERASVDSSGAQGNWDSEYPVLSADGRYVAFESLASNLVGGDTNAAWDVFVHDRFSGTTERVSVDSSGAQANSDSRSASISADGRYVAFASSAGNLAAGGSLGTWNIYVRDRQTGTTECVGASADSDSGAPAISGDGRYVAFWSYATNLVPNDTNSCRDVFVYDRSTQLTERVSVDSAGAQANAESADPALSGDGRYVAFWSDATQLVGGDTNGARDVFVHDRQFGTTERVSVDSSGAQANGECSFPSLSANGDLLVFSSSASNLAPGGALGEQVFLHDRQSGATTLASVDTNGNPGNSWSSAAQISGDGNYVAFLSPSTNLVPNDTNAHEDIFVRDRGTSAVHAFCFGDGGVIFCPCLNFGLPGHGCDNSAGTSGATLSSNGTPSLAADNLQFSAAGELPSALSIVLQGSLAINPVNFGDGLRCAGGALKRLYVKSAVGGAVVAPVSGDLSVSARSAALGDTINQGDTRIYQVYYRDPNASFCPAPTGNTFNISSALSVLWGS
jgi:Tol biopolymer transport system component